ncbi:uncharacterized protein YBR016W [Selaginella moellendorffii]|uniref:uncharacterized protein YBR016W n=1 Tax=Selaginella moellendorffii TaxID=88036 RepID=UPI000D1CADAA|nr:uncharacterized protein YBR016W [Selaginella moellendorffii]|eukprot:XP_024545838.1 uncharacterized protein YBR016W [Selaginella moellendorffii]
MRIASFCFNRPSQAPHLSPPVPSFHVNRHKSSERASLFKLPLESFLVQSEETMGKDYETPYPPQGYPPQGYYQQPPPVAPPPQYYSQAPPRRSGGFLQGCLAALCCCCLLDECCCDPTILIDC